MFINSLNMLLGFKKLIKMLLGLNNFLFISQAEETRCLW